MKTKKSKIGVLGALAIGAATMLGGAVNANALPTETVTQQNKKEAIPEQKDSVRPVSKKGRFNGYSNENPYKRKKAVYDTQRKYRKLWRRCPHMRNKK